MEIRNHTLYNKDLIVRYNQYYLVDMIKKNFSILAIISIGFAVYLFIEGGWQNALLLLGMVLLYLGLMIVVQKVSTAKAIKKSPLVEHPVVQNYTFTEEKIIVEGLKTREMGYNEIVRIQGGKEFLILTDASRRVYVVDMAKFDYSGAAVELKQFINLKFKKHLK